MEVLTGIKSSQEASKVLYANNTFDFDHPLSAVIFLNQVSPEARQSLQSISIVIPTFLDYKPNLPASTAHVHDSQLRCKSFERAQWTSMWSVIKTLEDLRSWKLKFKFPIEGWMGWNEIEVLAPLKGVKASESLVVEAPGLMKGPVCGSEFAMLGTGG